MEGERHDTKRQGEADAAHWALGPVPRSPREPTARGRAVGAYCRVPQTLRAVPPSPTVSCVMVGMSKRHHLLWLLRPQTRELHGWS